LVCNQKTGQIRTWEDPVDLSSAALSIGPLVALSFSSDGQELFIGKAAGVIDAWNLTSDKHRQLIGHSRTIRALLGLRGSTMLASSSDDGTVRLWNTSDGTSRIVQQHQGAALAIAISPNQREIFSGGTDGMIRKFDRATDASEVFAQLPSAIE